MVKTPMFYHYGFYAYNARSRALFKNRILAQDRGGFMFHTAGILKYVEDGGHESNKDIEPKDIFNCCRRSTPAPV
jgi:hypothetical protein